MNPYTEKRIAELNRQAAEWMERDPVCPDKRNRMSKRRWWKLDSLDRWFVAKSTCGSRDVAMEFVKAVVDKVGRVPYGIELCRLLEIEDDQGEAEIAASSVLCAPRMLAQAGLDALDKFEEEKEN